MIRSICEALYCFADGSAFAVKDVNRCVGAICPGESSHCNRRSVRRGGNGVKLPLFARTDGWAQNLQQFPGAQVPDPDRLVLGSAEQKPLGCVYVDAADFRRMGPGFDARIYLGLRLSTYPDANEKPRQDEATHKPQLFLLYR